MSHVVRYDTDQDGPPSWFTAALTTPSATRSVVVDGAPIVYREWGAADAPPLVLLHGIAAHSHWWDHIAPLLAQWCRVVAIDFSGHGDSGRRRRYSKEVWGADVLAVLDAAGLERPTVVGHSLGGAVALTTAARYPGLFDAIIVVETSFLREPRAATDDPAVLLRKPHQIHPTRDAAAARWRPLPAGDVLPFVASHVAAESVTRHRDGWAWKFDSEVFGGASTYLDEIGDPGCPVALVRGGAGAVAAESQAATAARLPADTLNLVVPGAGHNVPLDSPVALVAVVETLLVTWRPARR